MAFYYESAGIIATWDGISLNEGWAADTFLTITPSAERVTHTAGADGQYGFSKMADKGATITMTFQQSAPINDTLASVILAQDVLGADLRSGVFSVVDTAGNSGNFLASGVVLSQIPTNTFGNAMGEKTWTWICESYLVGPSLSDITSVSSTIF